MQPASQDQKLTSEKPERKQETQMSEEQKPTEITYEIRVTPGRAGVDPNEPDWEVLELEDGVVQDTADIYNNMTLAEANNIAGMWSKKKEEAESQDAAD
jgi:hypothetical protein